MAALNTEPRQFGFWSRHAIFAARSIETARA
jgi:hypothetical protein